VAETSSTPYPIDALPGAIGAAVRDVVGFVQCPPALAACSALSALSLVGQGLADVRRTEGLTGPCSLFILAIADSGERKTTCDGFFLSSLRAWEAAQIEGAKPDQAQHAADLDAWEAQRDGLRLKIKENSRKDHASEAEGRELRELEVGKPTPPRVPRLLYVEATPEALAFKLATVWPSAGVLSSEAGIVFGGHGNRSESVMRNLAQLNVLWDGGMLPIDRRTSESFVVRGARLTMGLAVQPDTVRTFLEATKGLARGSGFAARFLIAWPTSTQGYRPLKDAPEKWPGLSAFHRRIEELLRLPLPITEAGTLEPTVLPLDPKAKAAWVGFADDVEIELRPGGDMEQARDVASKAADNAARLAALFHNFEHGPVGAVGVDHVLAAATIVGWHLYEARRFLGEMALPVEAVNAARLESWLVDKCRSERLDGVSTRDVMRMGPNPTRARKALEAAVAELVEAGRARLVQEGRRRWIEVRPELLKDGGHGTP
jgi:putative DNA primase/helicase